MSSAAAAGAPPAGVVKTKTAKTKTESQFGRKNGPLADKIVAAVHELSVPGGASRAAIGKKVAEYQNGKPPQAAAFRRALTSLLDSGKLEKGDTAQRFVIPGVVLDRPRDEVVGIEVISGGSSGKDSGGSAGAQRGDSVVVSYRGVLEDDGSEFDSAKKFDFTLGAGEVIKGWDDGVEGMLVGEKRRLTVPPKLGYGKRGAPPEIPGNATLIFEVRF
jgi:FKBP-type peptidyl-prolyl cis-trans isomerase